MLELSEAYEILGLTEGASRDDIEKKYGKLVRKYTADKSGDTDSSEMLSKVNEAYNRLVFHENELYEAAQPKKKPNPIYKLVGVDDKKASNFIHYHKWHFIIGALILVLVIYLGNSIFNRHIPDITVEFIGEYAQKADDTALGQTIKEDITKNIPEIKDVQVSMVSASAKVKNQQDAALNNKANLELVYGEGDVMIVDERFFTDAVANDLFMNLDNVIKDIKIDEKANENYKVLIEGKKSHHQYGVDVGKSKIIKKSNVLGREYIAVIKKGCKHEDSAKKLIRLLLEK